MKCELLGWLQMEYKTKIRQNGRTNKNENAFERTRLRDFRHFAGDYCFNSLNRKEIYDNIFEMY